jgi:transcriptional regulator with XRE-family HTH domain
MPFEGAQATTVGLQMTITPSPDPSSTYLYYSGLMVSGDLIKEARLRAGLTQRELGARLARAQSVIARWERNDVSPSLETLREVIRACGFDLTFFMSKFDDSSVTIIDQHLRMTPAERFADLMTRVRFHEQREKAKARRRD